MSDGLSKSLLINTLWSFIGRFGYLAVALVSNIILVRLLSPKEFGQLGIIMFFIILATVLVESGLSGALIRKEDVTEIDYSTVFIFNLIISIILFFLLTFLSGFIADFYNDPELKFILIASSFIIIINALRITQNTKLIKTLQFKIKAFYEFISILLGSIVAIFLAFKGAGIWSLVVCQLLTALTLTCIFWFFVGPIKSIKFSINSFKNLYKFGVNTTLASLLNTTFDNIYQLILAKYFSIAQAGYFYQAKKLQDIPTGVLETTMSSVVYASLSKIQKEPEKFNNLYYNTVRIFTVLIAFIFMVIFYYSDFIIYILYGESWVESAIYLKLLVIASFFYLQEIFNRIIFKIFNKTEKILQLEFVKKIIQSFTIFYGLYTFSIKNLLYGFILTSIISFLLNYYAARKVQNSFSINDFMNIFKVVIISILVVIICNILYLNLNLFNLHEIFLIPFFILFYFIFLNFFGVISLVKDFKSIYYLIVKG